MLVGLVLAFFSASGLSLITPAFAQCSPDGIANTDVVCTANDLDGFVVDPGDLNSFTVQPNVHVGLNAPRPIGPFGTVYVDGTLGTFRNDGTIAPALPGYSGVDVFSLGPGGFTNTGTIESLLGAPGVYVEDDIVGHFLNSGTISGSFFPGLWSEGNISTLTNTGVIVGYEGAIEADNIGTLVNYGLIDGFGDGVDIDGGGSDNDENSVIGMLINHGTIRGDDDGIDVGTLTSLVNTGTILGGFFGADESGIAAAVITSIVNSGTIATGGDLLFAYAIEERGPLGVANEDSSLTLNAGSILIGLIDLGGGTNTLNIGAGRSINSRFDSDDGIATLPVLGTLAGHLVAFSGTATQRLIVAVDPSAFASFHDALAALTVGIGQTVQGRQAALRSDPALGFASRYAAAQETSLAAFSDLDLEGAPHLNPNRFWIEGFGAYRQDNGDRVGYDFEHLTGGLVAGVDVPLDAITSVGVMAGFAASTSENEINTQETDTMSYYAGVYASTEALGLAWDASLTVGYTDYDADRTTANNLVAGGLETASADFGGWFINPQVTMTREAANLLTGSALGNLIATNTLEQSLTLSYAGLFLDGYTETGTTNPLTLDDRDVHIASARAALALPFERIEADGALTTIRLIGGVEARTQFGDDAISGTLLGQTVSTTLDDDDATFGAFLGLSGEYQTTSALTAYANAEALLETNAAYQISATAGLRIAF